MKAIRLSSPKELQMANIHEPDYPGIGEVLVRVHRIALGSSDFDAYDGSLNLMQYPRILGHELGLEVLAVGSGVYHVDMEDRCCLTSYLHCGKCEHCKAGVPHQCTASKRIGFDLDGGLRDRFLVPGEKLHKSKTLNYEQLALVEWFALAKHAVSQSQLKSKEQCLILSEGPLGLAVAALAQLAGATVTLIDPSEFRLAFAREQFPKIDTIQHNATLYKRASRDWFGNQFPQVVIDTTKEGTLGSDYSDYLSHPTLRWVTVYAPHNKPFLHEADGSLPAVSQHASKRIDCQYAAKSDYTATIQLLEEGKIDVGPWMTHRTNFQNFINDFPKLSDAEPSIIKAIVEMKR